MVPALVLLGVIFFTVAGMVLCFRFVLKTVRLYRDVFALAELHLHSIKAFSASCIASPVRRLGLQGDMGGDTAQLTPIDQRDVTNHIVSCSAYNSEENRREGGIFGVTVFVFLSHHCVCWEPWLSWRWLSSCWPVGGGE